MLATVAGGCGGSGGSRERQESVVAEARGRRREKGFAKLSPK